MVEVLKTMLEHHDLDAAEASTPLERPCICPAAVDARTGGRCGFPTARCVTNEQTLY